MISNVTAGNVNQIQAVIGCGLIPPVIDIITKVTDHSIFSQHLFQMFNLILARTSCLESFSF